MRTRGGVPGGINNLNYTLFMYGTLYSVACPLLDERTNLVVGLELLRVVVVHELLLALVPVAPVHEELLARVRVAVEALTRGEGAGGRQRERQR